MECPQCGNPQVLVEAQPGGNKHIKCTKCGLDEIRDAQGRKLLLDAVVRDNVLLS